MPDPGPEYRIAQRLLEGVAHLREGRTEAAVSPLTEVCDDEALANAPEMLDVRTRAHTLLVQALLDLGRPAEARPRLATAEQLVASLDDPEGKRVLADLRGQIGAAEAAIASEAHRERQSRHLASLSLDEVVARVRDPNALVDVLIRKANADADAGRPDDALPVAERALRAALDANDPRLEVLARLSIARVAPDRAGGEVRAALACADKSGETGLITAVAKAADLHGVALPSQPGGGRPL